MASPVIHEPVELTEEGAKVWEEMRDPSSPVGKPVRFKSRALRAAHRAMQRMRTHARMRHEELDAYLAELDSIPDPD